VFAIALQPDGKAVIGGDLRRGSQPEAFMRLNTDGSRDPSFVSGSTHGPQFGAGRSLAIQSDGKIVISGDFRITTTPNRNYSPIAITSPVSTPTALSTQLSIQALARFPLVEDLINVVWMPSPFN
jgi:hypothetical protein